MPTQQNDPDKPRMRSQAWLASALALGVIIVLYLPSLSNGPVWDDRDLVTQNPHLGSWHGLGYILTSDLWTASAKAEPSSFYRPLTMLTYWVSSALGGSSAGAHRLVNVLIHALNAILLMVVLRKVGRASVTAATALAMIWAVAPLMSEAVLWISGRFDLLSVTFALLAILANERAGKSRIVLVVLACIGGLLTKESFVGWLPVVLLHDILLRRAGLRELMSKSAVIVAAVVLYLGVRAWIRIPSGSVFTGTGLATLAQSAAFLLIEFFRQTALPTRLDPFRPYVPPSFMAAATIGLVVLAALIALGVATYRRRQSPHLRAAWLGVSWFGLSLAPVTVTGPNLLMVGDRYAYLPFVGLAIVGAAAIGGIHPGPRWRFVRWAGVGVAAATLVFYSWFTRLRIPDWFDDDSLARSSLRSSPGNPYALYSLGVMLAERGQLDDAEELLVDSVQREPRSWRTWNALCFTHLRGNRLEAAEQECRQSLGINPDNPRTWVNLAAIFVRRGDWRAAHEASGEALSLKPAYPEALYMRAVSAANLGDIAQALSLVEAGRRLDPTHEGLANLDKQMRDRGHER